MAKFALCSFQTFRSSNALLQFQKSSKTLTLIGLHLRRIGMYYKHFDVGTESDGEFLTCRQCVQGGDRVNFFSVNVKSRK